MVNYTIEQIRKIMDTPQNIRNTSIIAHVDHGKSTLADALVCKAGIIANKVAGLVRYTDTREDQKERGITIKSTGVSMYYQYDISQTGIQEEYLINLIDSPGHVDFSSEVTAALRATDGALVVIDAVEGVCVQTQTVLRQAMQQKIRPVLMINKIDRNILELKLDGQSMYQNFIRMIDVVNVIISAYNQQDMGELLIQPSKGNCAFGSGKQQWAFSLTKFARIYANKFAIDFNKMMNRLWGDHFYDSENKKWSMSDQSVNGKKLTRAFVLFIMDPICKLSQAIMSGNEELITKMLIALDIKLLKQEEQLKGKSLLKVIMNRWLNAADTLLQMMVLHLPSPVVAQKYRTDYLYEGPKEDICATAMRNCDPKGPLMIYISKMVPSTDKGRFYAFGRIFSGTVFSGQNVRIMGANYQPDKKEQLYEKKIQRTVVMMGRTIQYLPSVPCGNTVALVGIDQYLMKTGTISDHPDAHTIRSMKYSVSPVVRVAVAPKNVADLPKLVQGLKKLSKSDPLVIISTEQTGQKIISGCGQLHVQICLNDLQKDYAQCEIIRSDPVVTYKQTITQISNQKCLAKTQNKLNRFLATSQPIMEELTNAIQKEEIFIGSDIKERSKILCEKYNWEKEDSMKIWCFGPESNGSNVLVDMTKGIQYMKQIKDSMTTSFQNASKSGVLSEQNMRGFRVNLIDAEIHSDPMHRGGGQIIPTARRLYYACQLTSNPTLVQPIFICQITAPMEVSGGVYQCLSQRRGKIIEEEQIYGSKMNLIKAYLPVSESFGFTGALRGATQGKAFPQCVFNHWEQIKESPLDIGSQAEALIRKIRKRKGLKEQIPQLKDYLDKL